MTLDQLTGPLRSLLPLLTAVLVSWGFNDTYAGIVSGVIVLVVAGAWSWYSNRPAALVTEAAKTDDVTVVVGPGASSAVLAVASNPKMPNVVHER